MVTTQNYNIIYEIWHFLKKRFLHQNILYIMFYGQILFKKLHGSLRHSCLLSMQICRYKNEPTEPMDGDRQSKLYIFLVQKMETRLTLILIKRDTVMEQRTRNTILSKSKFWAVLSGKQKTNNCIRP